MKVISLYEALVMCAISTMISSPAYWILFNHSHNTLESLSITATIFYFVFGLQMATTLLHKVLEKLNEKEK